MLHQKLLDERLIPVHSLNWLSLGSSKQPVRRSKGFSPWMLGNPFGQLEIREAMFFVERIYCFDNVQTSSTIFQWVRKKKVEYEAIFEPIMFYWRSRVVKVDWWTWLLTNFWIISLRSNFFCAHKWQCDILSFFFRRYLIKHWLSILFAN